jgi:glycine cleavage system H lipoate-binding protein
MTVILMLIMFTAFILIDHFLRKKQAMAERPVRATKPEGVSNVAPVIVAGFKVPENLRYHPGHTWALSESPNLVRVGMDDFATKLAGKVERITLPQRGQWIRQGQKFVTLFRDGSSAEMVSPIEGVVSDVNDAALNDLEAARKDPYGEGWLMTVQAPDAKTNFRNLLTGATARSWMAEAARQLRLSMPAPAGAFAQDGGVAVDDLTAEIPNQAWAKITREFFLS